MPFDVTFPMKRILILVLFFAAASALCAQPMVVIARHAEKANSADNDPTLSHSGRARAEALARMLKDADISAIFTTEFKRTKETAAPAASALGITPTVIPASDITTLAAKLRYLRGNALVIGHGNTIPDLLKALGIDTAINIPENDYNQLFIVSLGDHSRFVRLHYP